MCPHLSWTARVWPQIAARLVRESEPQVAEATTVQYRCRRCGQLSLVATVGISLWGHRAEVEVVVVER